MRLIDNWKEVVKKGWSMKLIAASFALDILERALPYITFLSDTIPPGIIGYFSLAVLALAAGARVLAQPEITYASPAAAAPQADSKG